MASVGASEKRASIKSDDGFEGIDISVIDCAFLMSLMEELQDQVEETSDEERLKSVIESLEAEINSCMEPADYPVSPSDSGGEDSLRRNSGQLDDDGCPASFDDLDMNACIDMEAVPCSPSNDLNCYMYPCEDEMSSSTCFVNDTNYLGVALDQDPAYNCLWKEATCDLMM